MPVFSREVHLVGRPDGLPTEDQFALRSVDVPDAGPGQVQVQNLYMSVDPAMRPPLTNGQTPLNKAMTGGALGRVLQSQHPAFREGDIVQSRMGFREFFVSDGQGLTTLHADPALPLTVYMHALGGTGLTAYGGLLEIGALQDGEHVFVSAAAGAVGSVAAQIAKIKGCYTIGSAGSEDKCAWLRNQLNLDAVINYKQQPIRKALKAAAPNGIDVYFDNVGGEHLQAAIGHMREFGRIALCGSISMYNDTEAGSGITNLPKMVGLGVNMRGFLVRHYAHMRPDFLRDMSAWLAAGRVTYRETVMDGIESAPDAFIGLFKGANIGKMVVRITEAE